MISAVILAWNSEKYIDKCLKSLFADAKFSREKIEVFVIDNGSSDSTPFILESLKKQRKNLNLIRLKKNLGTTASRNIGICRSSGDYILVLDSDTEIQHGALKELIKTLKSKSNIGIAAPRLFNQEGIIQHSCRKFPTLKIKICKFLPFRLTRKIAATEELYSPEVYKKNFARTIYPDCCMSAAWMIKKEALKEVGLFDENIFYSPEDVDYCLRMRLKGWKTAYNPEALVLHHFQRKSYKNPAVALSHAKGLLYYFRKHRYLLSRKKVYENIPK